MKSWWLKTAARYDALQRRERWLVAVALLGGIVLLGHLLFIEPALQRGQAAERGAAGARVQLADMQAQVAALDAPNRHPDVAARAELDALRAQLDALGGRLQALEGALVPPDRMAALLEEMIGTRSGLRLLSLKTLPATPFPGKDAEAGEGEKAGAQADKAAAASAPGGKAGGLYRHGVEIRLEGGYQELAAYLARLEKSPMKLLWGGVALSAERHPRLVLTLTVYSLSMDRAWLIV